MSRPALTLLVASVGILMAVVDVTIVNVALPSLQRDLHAGFAALQWIVNAYTIPLAVLLLTAGKLSDIFGRRRLFVIGLCIFTAGSALCAASNLLAGHVLPPLAVLLTGRAIQGAGSAVLVPVSLAIVNEAFHEDEAKRTTAVGIRGAMVGLGLAMGPLLGGLLLARFSWSSIFLINLPIGAAAGAVAMLVIDESCDPSASRRIDLFGLLTLSAAVLAMILGLVLVDQNAGAIGALNVGLVVGGFAVLGAFIVGELRLRDPLYDLRLFANRSFTGVAASAFFLSAAVLGLLFFLTLYLQNVLGFSPLRTGVALLPLTAMVLVVSPFAGRATLSIGARTLVTCGMISAAVGVVLLHFTAVGGTSAQWALLVPSFLAIGLGMGLANPAIVAVATGTVEHERAGLAAGLNTVCRQLGTAFGVALIGAFVTVGYARAVATHVPPATARALVRAGTAEASSALRAPSPQARRLRAQPGGSALAKLAQRSWVGAFHLGLTAAAVLLGLGALGAFATIRKRDLLAARVKKRYA